MAPPTDKPNSPNPVCLPIRFTITVVKGFISRKLLASFRGAGRGMGLLGVISVLLGGALLFNTLIGVALMPYLLGVVELVGGLVAFFFAFKLRAGPAH